MAYNTKSIVKDTNRKPVPQYYNPTLDVYEVLEGLNGASKTTLYDKDGNEVKIDDRLLRIINILAEMGEGHTSLLTIYDIINEIYEKDTTQTYYGLSTDTKPTSGMIKGNTYFEIDTSEVYMWNGTSWVVI